MKSAGEQPAGQPRRQGLASQDWHRSSSARSWASVRSDGDIGHSRVRATGTAGPAEDRFYYGPDLNPIGLAWSKLKALLRLGLPILGHSPACRRPLVA